jgi:hypothetical protein
MQPDTTGDIMFFFAYLAPIILDGFVGLLGRDLLWILRIDGVAPLSDFLS